MKTLIHHTETHVVIDPLHYTTYKQTCLNTTHTHTPARTHTHTHACTHIIHSQANDWIMLLSIGRQVSILSLQMCCQTLMSRNVSFPFHGKHHISILQKEQHSASLSLFLAHISPSIPILQGRRKHLQVG